MTVVKNERLINLRVERGMTQEQAADQVGITRQYMGMIESGERTGTLRVLRRIADLYGVTVDSLFFASEGHRTCPEEATDSIQEVKPGA